MNDIEHLKAEYKCIERAQECIDKATSNIDFISVDDEQYPEVWEEIEKANKALNNLYNTLEDAKDDIDDKINALENEEDDDE